MSDTIATLNGLVVTRSSIYPNFSIFSADDDTWYAEIYFHPSDPPRVLMRNITFGQPVAVVREFAAALTLAAEIADAGPTWKPTQPKYAEIDAAPNPSQAFLDRKYGPAPFVIDQMDRVNICSVCGSVFPAETEAAPCPHCATDESAVTP